MASDELGGARTRVFSRQTQIVDAQQHDDVGCAGLRQDIAIEPRQRADTHAPIEDPVAIDTALSTPISGPSGRAISRRAK